MPESSEKSESGSAGPDRFAVRPRYAVRKWMLVVAGVLAIAGTVAGIGPPSGPVRPHRIAAKPVSATKQPTRPRTDASAGPRPVDSAFFARGACVAFPPTRGDNGLTVFLDAGHGGVDPGGTGYTSSGALVREAPVNLRIELRTARLLRAHGYRVVVSRTGTSGVARLRPGDMSGHLLTPAGVHADVAARDICANKAGADVLVGIYMDAGGGQGSLTAYDPSRPFWPSSKRLATLLQRDVLARLNAAGLGIPNDGVVADTGLGSSLTAADQAYGHLMLLGPAKRGYFTTPSTMPGALIEPLYLTDPFEASVAASVRGQRRIAAGIATAVEQYFAQRVSVRSPGLSPNP